MKLWVRIIVAAWMLGLPIVGVQRLRVFHDDPSLWTDAVSQAPTKARPLNNYGLVLENAGNPRDAARYYYLANAATHNRPEQRPVDLSIQARSNLAHALITLKNYDGAEEILIPILRTYRNATVAQLTYAQLLFAQGLCTTISTTPGKVSVSCPSVPY